MLILLLNIIKIQKLTFCVPLCVMYMCVVCVDVVCVSVHKGVKARGGCQVFCLSLYHISLREGFFLNLELTISAIRQASPEARHPGRSIFCSTPPNPIPLYPSALPLPPGVQVM